MTQQWSVWRYRCTPHEELNLQTCTGEIQGGWEREAGSVGTETLHCHRHNDSALNYGFNLKAMSPPFYHFHYQKYHWRELPQVSFLSRQKHVFVATKHIFCRNKTHLLSQQNICHNNIMFAATKQFCCVKTFVATNICRNKHTFLMTKVLSRRAYFCRNKNDTCGSPCQWYFTHCCRQAANTVTVACPSSVPGALLMVKKLDRCPSILHSSNSQSHTLCPCQVLLRWTGLLCSHNLLIRCT